MAVESLQDKVYSTKSDCWSFAVTVWEVLNRSDPYPEMDAFTAASKVLYEGLRLQLPTRREWPVLYDVMVKNFDVDPEKRLDMATVCTMLEKEGEKSFN